ncbi:MAG: CoA transferase [Deinococcales bacterium]|nr:CoA transferase [Deinococcales bacterium]
MMLEEVTVLDLTRVLAGPYCTQLLSDLGATVIKIESVVGDDTRSWGPPFVDGESAYYLSTNRGKKSVVVNLKDERGRSLVSRLAMDADVLVENFKTGDLVRYGLDYQTLQGHNPQLVYTSITGFGQTGPRAAEPGYDASIQGLVGLMAMTGEKNGGPTKIGVAWVDVLTGVHAATGILAALYERNRTGKGRYLYKGLFDVALARMVNQAQATLLTCQAPVPLGSGDPSLVPYQAFLAREGSLVIAVGNDTQFTSLCEVLDITQLASDARFATNESRVEHREVLVGKLESAFLRRDRDDWIERLRVAGVPVTPVNTLPEALGDPQVAARHMVSEIIHPTVGPIPMVGSPFGKVASRRSAPPYLGQHTREVLEGTLGLTRQEIDGLIQDSVVGSDTKD